MYNTFHPPVERISHVSQREMRKDPDSTTNLVDDKTIDAQSASQTIVDDLLDVNTHESIRRVADEYTLGICLHDVN
jgi:hypothetical protein